jgi:preprotein translocase subunit SecD
MEKKFNWKAFWVFGLLVLAVLQLLPTFMRYKDAQGNDKSHLPEVYTSFFDKQLSYGLDLKGGLELRYTVDYKKAIGDNTRRLTDSLADRLGDAYAKTQKKDWATLGATEKKTIGERWGISRTAFNAIKVEFKTATDKALLTGDVVAAMDSRFELRNLDDKSASLFMPDKAVQQLKNEIVNQTLDVIRKRVDAFGLVEPDVRRSGDSDIDLQLPGLSDRQMRMVRERIGQAAQLTFRMVKPDAKVFDDKAQAVADFKTKNPEEAKTLTLVPDPRGAYLRADKKSELVKFVKEVQVPEDVLVGYNQDEDRSGKAVVSYWRTYNVEAKTGLTGDNLTRAVVGYKQQGSNEPVVNLEFDSRGANLLSDVSAQNIGNQMAIMLDDDVSSAPQIKDKLGAHVQITLGRNTGGLQAMMEEATSLVTVLNNGAYKAPVIKVHDIEVGPSLGADAVKSGLLSMVVGVALVIAFMLLYYRQGGVIANAALLLNIVLQLACLVWFNAALTLPGMAGLTLTTAMAVDANILIFERIREELRAGRGVRNALDLGYGRAFWTIFDSHITAGMAGGVLMIYSTGPIYGFAVTLLIGIGTSMFTSIVATRLIYDWMIARGKIESLSV